MTMVNKRPIWVLSSHTYDHGGGFYWKFAETVGNRDEQLKEYERDVEYGYAHVALVEIWVSAPEEPSEEDRHAITALIDGDLLDLIETRQIGRIIKAHDRWGVHPLVDAHQDQPTVSR